MTRSGIFETRLLAALLVVATFTAYLPAWYGHFVWDDDSWTTLIPNLLHDAHGLWRMWTVPTSLQQYYPLTGTTFWLDHHLWGNWTLPYHLENITLHTVAALLFWRLLRRLAIPGAALAAGIFALHPLMVESVAWITERKNVLSLALYLAALLCYGRFTDGWTPPADAVPAPSRRARWYAGALTLFLAALAAKTTALSLPAVVLLLCWWRRGRLRWREDVLPTLPFFVLAMAFGVGVSLLERRHIGAWGPDFALTPWQRVLVVGRALWFYPGKLLWPVSRCFIYPRWKLDPGAFLPWLYPLAALAVLPVLFLARHRLGRGPAAAAFFYVGTVFPVTGVLNGYFMLYAFVWDHLAYLPSLGLITALAAGTARAAEHLRRPWLTGAVAALLLPALAALTWQQSAMYQDVFTFYRTILRQNPACWLADDNLGVALMARGQTDQAITLYQQAIALRPAFAEARNNLANAFARTGRPGEAIAQYQAALAADSGLAAAHANLAAVLAQTGRFDEAIFHYQQAANAGQDRAAMLSAQGSASLQKGDHRQAAECFARAFALRPADAGLGSGLAFLLATTADPTLRNAPAALALARRVNAQTGDRDPLVLRALAAVLAASGQFSEAAATAHRALEIALARDDAALAALLRADLPLYAAHAPLVTQP